MELTERRRRVGMEKLVRTMSQEWGPLGLRVNSVAPDCIATPRVAATYAAQGVDLVEQAKSSGVPMCRFGGPRRSPGPWFSWSRICRLCVTGQTIIVDGGTHARSPRQRHHHDGQRMTGSWPARSTRAPQCQAPAGVRRPLPAGRRACRRHEAFRSRRDRVRPRPAPRRCAARASGRLTESQRSTRRVAERQHRDLVVTGHRVVLDFEQPDAP